MATTKLTIKNGAIVEYRDRYFDTLSENGKEYHGNGWTVTIKDGRNGRPGRIICHSERMYSDGPAICHREFKLADGVVGLSGGNVYGRYAYFRTEEFSSWLKERKLQAVQKEDPNGTYYSRNPVSSYWSHDLIIETDGHYDYDIDSRSYTITGASYAVIRQRYCDGTMWLEEPGLLYTQVKNVMSIGDIAKR